MMAVAPSSASSALPLASRLLLAALPHIPHHGFTAQAVIEGAKQANITAKVQLDDAESIRHLFPGGPTSASAVPIRLLRTWDQEALDKLKSQGELLRQQEELADTQAHAIDLLQSRLEGSHKVRHHLLEPLSLLSALPVPPPLAFALQRAIRLPLPLPASIPNPAPLLQRAAQIANEACLASHADKQFGTEWYALRSRLAAAYLFGELHLLSPVASGDGSDASVALMRTLASPSSNPISSMSSDLQKAIHSGAQWVEWGGRGWRGIFRSWGWS